MNGEPPEAKRRPSRAFVLWPVLILVGLTAFASGGLLALLYAARGPEQAPASSTVVRGTSSVLSSIRDLARLEAVAYHVERVMDVRDRQAHLFGLFESEDAVLLVAAADVVAGVDLRAMSDGDIRFDRERNAIELHVPPPSILWARLDNERTYVHTRQTDPLAVRARTLETRARQEAERALREAAVEGGILLRARHNIEQTLTMLMRGVGYDHVEILFRAE